MNFRHNDVLNFNDSNIVTFGDGKFKGDVKEGGGRGNLTLRLKEVNMPTAPYVAGRVTRIDTKPRPQIKG